MKSIPYLTLMMIMVFLSCSIENEKTPKKLGNSKPKKTSKSTSLIQYAKEKKVEIKPKNPITNENVESRLLEYGLKNKETIVDIYTTKGKIRARLYKNTPLHRANFLLMTKKGFLNGSVFTRVSPGFIAQSGGTFDEDHATIKSTIGRYTIPSEMNKKNMHKRGAIAAARKYKENPEKRSDPYAFYFVEGILYNEPTLKVYERENNYKFSSEQREYYHKNPGAAHLDGQHTVFGEIISGYSVVEKITSVKTDSRDWPIQDIFIDSVKTIR